MDRGLKIFIGIVSGIAVGVVIYKMINKSVFKMSVDQVDWLRKEAKIYVVGGGTKSLDIFKFGDDGGFGRKEFTISHDTKKDTMSIKMKRNGMIVSQIDIDFKKQTITR